MEMNDRTWHLVKNTPKMTGFSAPRTTSSRRRSRDAEVARLTTQISEGTLKPKPKVQFEDGDTVRVIDGPFANFNGTVEEVNPEKGRVKVLVSHLRPRHAGGAGFHAGGEDHRLKLPRAVAPRNPGVGGLASTARLNHASKGSVSHEEGHRTGQAADSRREGEPRSADRSRARSAGRQHHGVLQAVQRGDAGAGEGRR